MGERCVCVVLGYSTTKMLTVYDGGTPLFSRSGAYTHVTSGGNNLLYVIENENFLQVIDCGSGKTVYCGGFDIGQVTFFQATESFCFVGAASGVY